MNTVFTPFEKMVMARLIEAAKTRKGYTLPNPVTAAAVVKNGKVISEGIHQKSGEPHAESIALDRCGIAAQGATLYITLEPCTHWGKQPPCANRIIERGITKVVYAIDDPNPKVREKSAKEFFSAAGIEVASGLLQEEALLLNAGFFKTHLLKQPFVTLKAGMSIDGKIALSNGQSKYITSVESRKKVHQLRRENQALLIGIGTVLADNPLLNCRDDDGPDLERERTILILDPEARLPESSALFKANPGVTIILLTAKKTALPEALKKLVTHWPFDVNSEGKITWPDILHNCYEAGIQDILIEGGPGVYSSALDQHAVDKVIFFLAPKLFGGENDRSVFATKGVNTLADVSEIRDMQMERIGPDIQITGYLRHPKQWLPH
ncbi:MAG: bifunctional diaminohydroxyphosphoribosylaminopyrimidine deaminase/5-amino-6-(5-phosphoribosylamino)uracil reductase RibD [Candidatus Margulisbacteria bacterium]|nr:bifunctional diaminohydroxyphosphoribosylaminopyrimidine deaminase/5-amino-6-(5-phosphoribosylamino)uracil reductase RibD [Candidatus Margulisiibacteriota bacterium]